MPLFTHAKNDPAASSTSVCFSNSTITKIKHANFLHNTDNDCSQRSSDNNAEHHQVVAEEPEGSDEFLQSLKERDRKLNEILKLMTEFDLTFQKRAQQPVHSFLQPQPHSRQLPPHFDISSNKITASNNTSKTASFTDTSAALTSLSANLSANNSPTDPNNNEF